MITFSFLKNSIEMAAPTPDQITTVQTNLTNMQALNDYVHSYGQDKISNAFMLFSETDSTDPGLTVVINVMEGVFWAVGSLGGMIGNFAASFLSGMLSYWSSVPPTSINGGLSSYLSRFSLTCQAIDAQLADYYADVAGNWDTQFTYNGNTVTLSDLATGVFPAETDPEFETMGTAALFALDQNIWKSMLVEYYSVTALETSPPNNIGGDQGTPPIAYVQGDYQTNPYDYCTWGWDDGTGCGNSAGWVIGEYVLGTGVSVFSSGGLNRDACNYLFIDSTPGVIINAAGLYTRQTVFTSLGIKQTGYEESSGGGVIATAGSKRELSAGYLRAMKDGKTLSQLIGREGRKKIEQRILDRAAEDLVFRRQLALWPRTTLENFLDVKIPEVIDLHIVVEGPRSFGLTIPALGSNSK